MPKTDKELFRDYLNSNVPRVGFTVGTLYLTGHECFDIDEMLRGVVSSILNADTDPQPVEELDFLMSELRGLLGNLSKVKEGFVAYKAAQEAA